MNLWVTYILHIPCLLNVDFKSIFRTSHLCMPWRLSWSCSCIHSARTCSILDWSSFLNTDNRSCTTLRAYSWRSLVIWIDSINRSCAHKLLSWRNSHITEIARWLISSWSRCFESRTPFRSLVFRSKSSGLYCVEVWQCLSTFSSVTESFVDSWTWHHVMGGNWWLQSAIFGPSCRFWIIVLRWVISTFFIKLEDIIVLSRSWNIFLPSNSTCIMIIQLILQLKCKSILSEWLKWDIMSRSRIHWIRLKVFSVNYSFAVSFTTSSECKGPLSFAMYCECGCCIIWAEDSGNVVCIWRRRKFG